MDQANREKSAEVDDRFVTLGRDEDYPLDNGYGEPVPREEEPGDWEEHRTLTGKRIRVRRAEGPVGERRGSRDAEGA